MVELKSAVGVDWASGYWLGVEYQDGHYERVIVKPRFEELWTAFDSKPDQILVDVPIGLFDQNDGDTGERGRECDSLARVVLGSRWSSVFTPPARQAAELAKNGKPHEDVSSKNRDVVGKGLSIQAYHIAPGIAEVDSFLHPDEKDEKRRRRERVQEAHPEVCFAAFAGEALEYSKTSAVGFGERLSALDNVVENPGETFREISQDFEERDGDIDVTEIDADDVLDAMALAITACADENERQTLPEEPPVDERELPMQMVYRAEEPVEVKLD